MRRRRVTAVLVGLGAVTLTALQFAPAPASTPPTQAVTVPTTANATVTRTWSGTIPVGAHATSSCVPGTGTEDHHGIALTVPAGAYDSLIVTLKFTIQWTPSTPDETTSDEILTVTGPGAGSENNGELGSSDTAQTKEEVVVSNPRAGNFDAIACGFANAAPQPYTGTLVLTTKAKSSVGSLPSANAQGLRFSATVPADFQRDEAEPLIEQDRDGNTYTCGPTGFSNAADYAQVSTDGGNQFHLLGTPPRGQISTGGGGDCAIGTGPVRTSAGKYPFAYTGLSGLVNFTTAVSPDAGRRVRGSPTSQSIPGVDRQWLVFSGPSTVVLNYNQQAPRAVVVQKSTDAGFSYGPPITAVVNPDFPGPIQSDANPAHRPAGTPGPFVYFPFNKGSNVGLAVSFNGGASWKSCLAAVSPGQPRAGFVTADTDVNGNMYIAYAEEADYHTYLVTLPVGRLGQCQDEKLNPGFSTPLQVDRDKVRTTVFPWLSAGGAPGRVSVAFYGTESDGNPNTGAFKASWNVYVNQSLNALSPGRTFSQVKATTHPFHYDSICLNGLGCDIDPQPGDRSLADFFAMDINKKTGRLQVVFNQGNKKPDEALGHIATPAVFTQAGGPSDFGGFVANDPRAVVRTASVDAGGDALSRYSAFAVGALPPAPATRNELASDLLNVGVGPEVNLTTGVRVPNGGVTVTLKTAKLTNADLQAALLGTNSQSLLWAFRFFNGYQAAAASARWNPVQGFTFGFNGFVTGSAQCGSSGEKCILYPGGTPIPGRVDQATGTIRFSVPRALLKGLSGPTGNGQRPAQVAATTGTRFYDASAFSAANPVSPVQSVQSFLYPLDNTPAMDFLLP